LASITLEDVSVDFPIYGSRRNLRKHLFQTATGGLIRSEGRRRQHVVVRALDRVSLKIEHGDRVGLMGHNGAGKSTLLRVLAGVYAPTEGRVAIEGGISPLFSASPGIDFDATGYENLVTCGMFLGMSRAQIAERTRDIEEFCELGEYLTLPMRTYSSGMVTRFTFALATTIDPEILLLDEGIGTGDARFAERAAKRTDALVGRSHILVIASHSDAMIRTMCNKAILMAKGRVIGSGSIDDMVALYHEQPAVSAGAALAGAENGDLIAAV